MSKRSVVVAVKDDFERSRVVMPLEASGRRVLELSSGEALLAYLSDHSADAVVLDLFLPDLSCSAVVERIRSEPDHEDLCLLVVGPAEERGAAVRCIALGADDYLSSDFDPNLLLARLAAADLRRTKRARRDSFLRSLLESRRRLDRELSEAACYVRGLLPPHMHDEAFRVAWSFVPSSNLGGDIFGYHRLPDGDLALYLVDVSGHGIEAALLSVTIVNALRNGALSGVDYGDPASVLGRLNGAFPTEEQNNMFFTVWYGVLDPDTGALRYSSAGAVPAVLYRPSGAAGEPSDFELLGTEGAAAGVDGEARYETGTARLVPGSRLLLFSDGLFEIRDAEGRMLGLGGLLAHLSSLFASGEDGPLHELILERAKASSAYGRFDDDVSLLELRFGPSLGGRASEAASMKRSIL